MTVNAIAPGPFESKMMAATLAVWGDEIAASAPLKRIGRLAIVSPPNVTSGRKMRLYPLRTMPVLLWNFARRGPKFLEHRENLDLWYDGRREAEPVTANTNDFERH